MQKRAFTLLEIMIVVAVIGLLAAIAMPNYIKSRQIAERNVCAVNLKHIQGAVQLWALENGKGSGDTPEKSDLVPNYLRKWPECKGVPYEIPTVDSDPVCPNSLPGHQLEGS